MTDDLCPTCGAYWQCDCVTGVQYLPDNNVPGYVIIEESVARDHAVLALEEDINKRLIKHLESLP